MQKIDSLFQMTKHLGDLSRKRMAVVCPDDEHTQAALVKVLQSDVADLILVGDIERTRSIPAFQYYGERIRHINAPDADEAARVAVAAVRSGEADFLMKGLINTDRFLHAVLNKECGLLPKGRVLTHLTVAEVPSLHRLLLFSDAAVIPCPTLVQRRAQVEYIVAACHKLGIQRPALSLIHFSEQVNEKFPVTLDYRALKEMAAEGAFGAIDMDGPLDVRTSCDLESTKIKRICSPVCGRADALIFPEIESANSFYKALTLFAGAEAAGVLQGTVCPVVLASRGDSVNTKFYSIALAAILSNL